MALSFLVSTPFFFANEPKPRGKKWRRYEEKTNFRKDGNDQDQSEWKQNAKFLPSWAENTKWNVGRARKDIRTYFLETEKMLKMRKTQAQWTPPEKQIFVWRYVDLKSAPANNEKGSYFKRKLKSYKYFLMKIN